MNNVFQILGFTAVVVILLCVGLFLYTEWDSKRFKESLPKVPPTVRYTQNVEAEQVTDAPKDPLVSTETRETLSDNSEVETQETPETVVSQDADFDMFLTEFSEEGEVDSTDPVHSAVDAFTEDAQDDSFDETEIVKIGFDDYNTYLSSNPEYAYQRLDDAFRAQYGDSNDVDILVRTIRHSNEGTATIEDAIENAEAFLRLASQISPSEGLQPIREHLSTLQTVRQQALEEGTELPLYHETHVFDPSR